MRKVGMGANERQDEKQMVPYDEYMKAVKKIGRLHELIASLQAELKAVNEAPKLEDEAPKSSGKKTLEEKK